MGLHEQSLPTQAEFKPAQAGFVFNPRSDSWQEHFIWSADGLTIIGLTPTGQATVAALVFNRERIINIRAADIEIGRHPLPGDPMQN